MEARNNGTAPAPSVSYTECEWGDLIVGTKEQLQALGLAVGRAYPGEVGGPRFEMRVRDPRGYAVRISRRYHRDESYTAYLTFPNWPAHPHETLRTETTSGLKKRECVTCDEYTGTAQALVDAGLVRADQLPGKPGMRKVQVTIRPDGTLPSGAPAGTHSEAFNPGARCIKRTSASSYQVRIYVSEEEVVRRRAEDAMAQIAWKRQVRALPRPARLQPMAPSQWSSFEVARAGAARDIAFQGFLARIVSEAGRPPL